MAKRGPAFIDRDGFAKLISEVPTAAGDVYEDVETIYGDMSRLVVGWLASADPEGLRRLYSEFGWGGSPNVRAINAAAKFWMEKYRRKV